MPDIVTGGEALADLLRSETCGLTTLKLGTALLAMTLEPTFSSFNNFYVQVTQSSQTNLQAGICCDWTEQLIFAVH